MFFPRRCPVCDGILPVGKGKICGGCYNKLNFIAEPRCKKCGKQIESKEEEYCRDCRTKKHYYDRGISLIENKGEGKSSVYAIKYRNKREYAEFYADEIKIRYEYEISLWGANLMIPVPLHKKKLRKRGYNQAKVIADDLGEKLLIPVKEKALSRIKNTIPLKTLHGEERKKCLKDAFVADTALVKGKVVVLVDDIYTTGSTIDECSKELISKGASKVYFITISIGEGM